MTVTRPIENPPRPPNDPRRRIRELLTRRNLSLAAASRMMGRNTAYLQQYLERGMPTILSEKNRIRLAHILEVDERELREPELQEPGAPRPSYAEPPLPPPNARWARPSDAATMARMFRDVPVVGKAQGGPDGIIKFEQENSPIDWTWRPLALVGVADAFGLFVDGDSMTSAGLPHGATVWVHPHRRPAPGDVVVLVKSDGSVYIKRYKKSAGGKVTIEQTDPVKEFHIPQAEVRDLSLVVGWAVGL
jgi:SOS-response transcriptional repressor LexA